MLHVSDLENNVYVYNGRIKWTMESDFKEQHSQKFKDFSATLSVVLKVLCMSTKAHNINFIQYHYYPTTIIININKDDYY